MPLDMPPLPIHAVLPDLRHTLRHHNTVILAAEPGSGKTTIVPLALLAEEWLNNQKIIVLEPRRLAVRMAAKRMSQICGQPVGQLVGYRIRFDRKTGPKTRIEVVTEGILIRMIQHDPELSGVGLVIFDEFHERTLMADLALALCHDVRELRGDLKMMLMSATLNNEHISKTLANAPVITGKGRCFPVDVTYLTRPSTAPLVPRVIRAVHQALAEQEGDILVFLPGAGEIRRVQSQIQGDCFCLPLYGNLPQREQDRIFAPSDKRRVILATPIAETSLTIEGISVVIDSGLMKKPRFSSATGLSSLCTIGISKASAKQRQGRAGRLCPGVCYRLWTQGEHHSKPEFSPPEILDADLAPLVLETLHWGVQDPGHLTWIDPPRPNQISKAKELLLRLAIINVKGHLTKLGQRVAPLPLHPRLALMIHKGQEQRLGWLACLIAALLQNRDIFRGKNRERSADIEDRLEILQLFFQNKSTLVRNRGADPDICRKIIQEARQYQRLVGSANQIVDFGETGNLLALAYPDRIAIRKKDASQHTLSSGRGVLLRQDDHLHHAPFLVVANLDGGKKQGRVFLAASLSKETIFSHHQHLLSQQEQVVWTNNRVESVTITNLGKLELQRTPLPAINPEAVRQCLLRGIQQAGVVCLNWQKKSRNLQARMTAAHQWRPDEWPNVTDHALEKDLSWLAPYLDGISSLKQLRQLNLGQILKSRLSWQQQQELDRLLPSHLRVASGSSVKLSYQPDKPPILAVRLQELFGTTTTPTVLNGTMPVLIHLLSPASRPMQITSDLAGFWKNTYPEVKKELMGRYPKHYWPADPLAATATSRVKRRKQ